MVLHELDGANNHRPSRRRLQKGSKVPASVEAGRKEQKIDEGQYQGGKSERNDEDPEISAISTALPRIDGRALDSLFVTARLSLAFVHRLRPATPFRPPTRLRRKTSQ